MNDSVQWPRNKLGCSKSITWDFYILTLFVLFPYATRQKHHESRQKDVFDYVDIIIVFILFIIVISIIVIIIIAIIYLCEDLHKSESSGFTSSEIYYFV